MISIDNTSNAAFSAVLWGLQVKIYPIIELAGQFQCHCHPKSYIQSSNIGQTLNAVKFITNTSELQEIPPWTEIRHQLAQSGSISNNNPINNAKNQADMYRSTQPVL